MTPKKYKWSFAPKFRKRSYPWNGTERASQQLKEAVREIRKVEKKDPELAAEGAIFLLEKIVPAIEQIDSSSGAIGATVHNTLQILFEIIGKAETTLVVRNQWLERIWETYQGDDSGFLDSTGDAWGRLCGHSDYSRDLALQWAREMEECSEERRKNGDDQRYFYFRGEAIVLSCLLEVGIFDKVISLVEKWGHKSWYRRMYAAMAYQKQKKLCQGHLLCGGGPGPERPGWPYRPILRGNPSGGRKEVRGL